MADTSVTYEGDGIETTFSVPFPYIAVADVKVELNGQSVLNPSVWTFNSVSGVIFRTAPVDGASIVIKRQTQGDTRVVDFQNGAVLTEADLDLSANQLFYLVQEAKENLTDLINAEILRIGSGNGIVSTTPDEIIAGLVETILTDATALNLSQRVQDIDDNAESILNVSTTLQSQVNALAQATAATVYVQTTEPVPGVSGVPDPIPDGARWYDSDDNNHPYIYDQGAANWVDLEDPRIAANATSITALDARLTTAEGSVTGNAASITTLNATVYDGSSGVVANANAVTQLQADVGTNAAAITTEQSARATADTAIASDVALLGAANGGQTAFILDSATVKIDSDVGDTIATRLSALSTADGDNAANITTEQTARIAGDLVIADELALLGAENGTQTAFILDTSTVKLDSDVGDTMAAKFSSLVAADATNTASITSEQTARISADGVLASDIALMGARNGAQTAFILDTSTVKIDSDGGDTFASRLSALAAADSSNSASITTIQTVTIPGVESDVATLEAKYGVSLNVNGYVTGFAQNNDGVTGSFVILADKFAIVDPTGDPAETEFVPFSVSGGVVTMQNVVINGSLIVNGTITQGQMGNDSIGAGQVIDGSITVDHMNVTDLSAITANIGAITAGSLTLNTSGFIKGGQTAYNTGTGFFLGYDTSAYKFSIGNATDNYMTWDGTTLKVIGDILVGEYSASDTAILSANTERTDTGTGFTRKKSFTVDRSGTVRVAFDMKRTDGIGQSNGWTPTEVRIYKNTTLQHTDSQNNGTYTTKTYDMTVVAGDEIHLDLQGGTFWNSGDLALEPMTGYIRNAQIKADVSLTTGGSADLD